jgi:hypothetical protein
MPSLGSPVKENDQTKYVFNPFTGELDVVVKFNPDRIVTNALNSAGFPKVTWNPESNSYVPDGPDVVVDLNGDVVVIGF